MMPALRTSGDGVRVSSLLQPWAAVGDGAEREVDHITLDSREVRPGALFLAVRGGRSHGLRFAAQALSAGAAAIAWDDAEEDVSGPAAELCRSAGVPMIRVTGLGRIAGQVAGRFYGEPSAHLPVVGVTGTDGKTSVSQFIAQALNTPRRPCGIIGTLGYGMLDALVPGGHTTPDAVRVQRLLSDLWHAGAEAVTMEVSSHALDQGRVSGVRFACAVLTNLSRDHLDYHGSEAAYAEAKARLFRTPDLGAAVLNADDAFGVRLAAEIPDAVRCLRYSLEGDPRAEIFAEGVEQTPDGLRIRFRVAGDTLDLTVPLLGRFNAANVLATASALLALDQPPADLRAALSRLRPVPGRMERFGGGPRPQVVVDYAHTPAALEAALTAVAAHFPGRIWCVFGCGGDRDAGKRPLMGAVAARHAHRVVLTDDNPRGEDADAIITAIRAGMPNDAAVAVVRNRAAAIGRALREAGPGDAVLVAGKGHEDYQIVGGERRTFSDRVTVEALLGGGARCRP